MSTIKEKNIHWVIRMIHMIYKLPTASLGFFLKRENLTPKAKKNTNSLIRADLFDIQRMKSWLAVGSKGLQTHQ